MSNAETLYQEGKHDEARKLAHAICRNVYDDFNGMLACQNDWDRRHPTLSGHLDNTPLKESDLVGKTAKERITDAMLEAKINAEATPVKVEVQIPRNVKESFALQDMARIMEARLDQLRTDVSTTREMAIAINHLETSILWLRRDAELRVSR